MQVRIWPASLPPPMASNASVAPVSTSALVRSSMKVGEVESTTYFAPILRRISACSDQPDAVLETDLVEHLPEIGCGRGVHQCFVAFASHGFGHAKRRQRIDEAG